MITILFILLIISVTNTDSILRFVTFSWPIKMGTNLVLGTKQVKCDKSGNNLGI